VLLLRLPLVAHPLHVFAASLVAAGPVLVFLEACHALLAATLGVHAIIAIRRARQSLAVPLGLRLFLPLATDPQIVGIASRVATRPVLVLLEARHAWLEATLGDTAIEPVGCARLWLAIPDWLVLLHPLIFHPEHVWVTSRVAARPVFILLEASHARLATALRGSAILTVRCARQLGAVPDRLVLLHPLVLHPQHVWRTCPVATRPVLVFLVARAVRISATFGNGTIFAIIHTLSWWLRKHLARPIILVLFLPPSINPQHV